MQKNTKIIIGIASSLVLLTGAFLILKTRKERAAQLLKEKEDLLRTVQEQKNLSAKQLKELEQKLKASSEDEKEALSEELLADIGNVIVGKYAHPKGSSVNVRTSAYVNNGWTNNLIYENYSKPVGLITAVVDSTQYGDKKKWYKVKLKEPFDGWTFNANYGYVREDEITVKNM
jgi:hypothetical protein